MIHKTKLDHAIDRSEKASLAATNKFVEGTYALRSILEIDPHNLQPALDLIKRHITADNTQMNLDLHRAMQIIATVGRHHTLLGGK